jgi:hypothetical protein
VLFHSEEFVYQHSGIVWNVVEFERVVVVDVDVLDTLQENLFRLTSFLSTFSLQMHNGFIIVNLSHSNNRIGPLDLLAYDDRYGAFILMAGYWNE